MQYRFKYNKSVEGRRSTHSHHNNAPKNDVLPYINLLDKCTQILREDRIWIRNQLKAGDPEITAIFKQAKKPLNLQHLQIRLRKYVASVKSKAKMEQLMKFKQNMQLGEWNKSKDHQQQYCQNYRQNLSHHPSKSFSSQSQSTVLNQSNTNTRATYKARANNSVEKSQKSMIYPYRNASGGHSTSNRKNVCEYPAPMEEITERQSENMTSARHRIMHEQNNQSHNFGMNYTYNQWKRPQSYTSPLQNLKKQISPSHKQFNNNFMESKQTINKTQNEFANRNLENQYQQDKHLFQEYQTNKQYYNSNQQQHSLNTYENSNKRVYQHQDYQHPAQIQDDVLAHNYSANKNEYVDYEDRSFEKVSQKDHYFKHDNTHEQQTNLLGQADTFSYNYTNTNKQQDLFTSPELLMECRNFIKSKSGAKSYQKSDSFIMPIHKQTNYAPLVFETSNTHNEPFSVSKNQQKNCFIPKQQTHNENLQDTMSKPFSNINCGFIESVKVSEPANSNEKGFKPMEVSSMHQNENFTKKQMSKQAYIQNNKNTYEFFHTFAAQSSQKKEIQEPNKIETPQEFVDLIIDNTTDEADGYISWPTLIKTVQRKFPQFVQTFIQYLQPQEGSQVLISNVGRVMQDLLQNQQQYQNQVKNIYYLLDIDRKGHISEEDIQQFISKLQDAQVQDIHAISDCLWRLYASIDQDSDESEEKRIDYWGVYARKMSKQFADVNEILKQFQFEIE